MKKILLIPFLLFAALSMTACGSGSDEPFTPEQLEQSENPGGGDDSDDNPDRPVPGGNGRYLVLFASRTNNTERVAQLIQTTLDCDILEVEPELHVGTVARRTGCHPSGQLSACQNLDGEF